MKHQEILKLGFKENKWESEGENFTEYIIGNKEIGILISGTTLVEITYGKSVFIHVPNCNTIEDLKHLLKLLNIK